jgi:hypothetical protein
MRNKVGLMRTRGMGAGGEQEHARDAQRTQTRPLDLQYYQGNQTNVDQAYMRRAHCKLDGYVTIVTIKIIWRIRDLFALFGNTTLVTSFACGGK